MSSRISDIKTIKDKSESSVIIKSTPEWICNSLKRTIQQYIKTYRISPESIQFKKNTSPWDSEMISTQISFLILNDIFFSKTDLNMIELNLNVVNNNQDYYTQIYSNDFVLRNKETNKQIDISKCFFTDKVPLFILGPNQEVDLTCQIQHKNKYESDTKHMVANIGFFTYESKGIIEKTIFQINNQSSIPIKRIFIESIDILVDKLKVISNSLTDPHSEKLYLEKNRNNRYNFIIFEECHTVGNIIEGWNNNNDPKTFTSYRLSKNNEKTIIIDFGFIEYSIDINNFDEKELLEVTSKKNEVSQKNNSIKQFTSNINNLNKYLLDLKKDFVKIKENIITNKEYMDYMFFLRNERLKI